MWYIYIYIYGFDTHDSLLLPTAMLHRFFFVLDARVPVNAQSFLWRSVMPLLYCRASRCREQTYAQTAASTTPKDARSSRQSAVATCSRNNCKPQSTFIWLHDSNRGQKCYLLSLQIDRRSPITPGFFVLVILRFNWIYNRSFVSVCTAQRRIKHHM
jgi:hypothetical protein